MTSKGIGDVRRVLGQPQSWIDQHFARPAPDLPDSGGDPLVDFLSYQIRRWESEVATESREYSQGPGGAAFLRWALNIRRQCNALRLVLAQYAEARAADAPETLVLREQLDHLATAFNSHPDWRATWD
ncbi:hypothetical protein [Kribbella jiaozuonensis]|uniref:Uncharacterized protein n=1 Tax=Kribbella jiaozuonensis TaxID=2575441 RepID=A0A4U3LWV7_9ACTN|nr:hypothetical protein [Kribbella jiaozuonensis]TKK79177.1 hypothetical protein FDA38_12155 [Kribbella jiaozuonensis]TKK83247.1 hypothetical protein FDA38_11110 [Kribbella jiaozuonensis]